MRRPCPSRRPARRGFSLLEVLLALSILLACLIVLAQMAFVGRRHAEDAEELTLAQLACRTRLSEILAGAAPLAPEQPTALENLPGWWRRVEVEPRGEFGLISVRVSVAKQPRDLQDGGAAGAGTSPAVPDAEPALETQPASSPRLRSTMPDEAFASATKRFTLVRWMHKADAAEPRDEE